MESELNSNSVHSKNIFIESHRNAQEKYPSSHISTQNTYTGLLKKTKFYSLSNPSQPKLKAFINLSLVDSSIIGTKIPIDPKGWYQLNHVQNGLDGLFDGNIDKEVLTGNSSMFANFDAYYPLKEGEKIFIQSIRFYDGFGRQVTTPFKLYGINEKWERILIATFTGEGFYEWVGPNPADRYNFVLSNPPTDNFRYLVINCFGEYPNEMELYGTYTPTNVTSTSIPSKNIKIKDGFGINSFEWDFLQNNDALKIDESKIPTFKPFSNFRQYMDWEKLEHYENVYTYNPCFNGGWNYDAIYERCKQMGIEVLPCLQGIPKWMYIDYPEKIQSSQLIPVKYGKNITDPSSYVEQAKVGFQYIARYGSNPNVDKNLLSIFDQPRWTNDSVNTLKVGMGLIKYIECGNERDKWWKGREYYQTAREHAANLSAFYDGHKNTMGTGVGVKNADPNIKVVMAGLAYASTDYVKGMIDWCKEFRGYKADGTVNLCWDVINYHLYSNNNNSSQNGNSTRGVAPEISNAGEIAKAFVQLAHDQLYDMPVWVTELGYDLNQRSPLKAIPIGDKTAAITQADWGLRSALMYNRLGIEKSFFYMLYDYDINDSTQFSSSGLVDSQKIRKPLADYLYQTKNLMGEYVYQETISEDPLVDRYELNGKSAYALMIPDEIGRTANYTLDLGNISEIKVFHPKAGHDFMDSLIVKECSGKYFLSITETPMFVIPSEHTSSDCHLDSLETFSSIYPNPTVSNILYISIKDISQISYVTIQNLSGVTVLETNVISSEGINVQSLPIGSYLLCVMLKDGRKEIHKVVISR